MSVQWLVVSVVLSVVLTLVVNIALRVVPELGPKVVRWLAAITSPGRPGLPTRSARARVFFPWKSMIVGSIVLSVLLTLLLRWVA